ncbi:hypothetical protein QBC34DRAFT_449125 [Podospora aff. communis PSN243]|uniref:mevalonate kinase n=1 Tax=Podospora aff. communis PSN243 TaxID=3040156 RepID=A0AAV9GRA7_9PEZI|nr:hypothetical protein QBC34DRAFT_449125 [Podospora aff. communis PSN243]
MTQRQVNGVNGLHQDSLESNHIHLNGVNGNANGTTNGNGVKSETRKRMDRKKSSPMMPTFMVSAPGKVIVCGEHAVVHGKAAIAASISLRSYLLVTTLSKSKRTVTLTFPDIDFDHTWNIDELPWATFSHPSKKKYYYDLVTELDPDLVAAIQPLVRDVSPGKPADIRKVHQNSAGSFLYMFLSLGSQSFPGCQYTLRSTIPIGAGLGSSATIAVCMSAALLLQLRTLSGPHPDQPPEEARLQVERINRWAFVYEMFIHGNPSGVDNTVSTQGKAVMFQRKDYSKPPSVKPLWDFPELPLLLVDTRTAKSTSAEVEKVRKLKEAHPKLVGSILDAVDKVTTSALELIERDDFDTESEESLRGVGELMNINHGLLVSLGVSHPRLERVRELVDHEGIGWTKLTGAGGGGCSITLLRPGVPRSKLEKLERQLEEEGYQKFETTLGCDGVGVLWPAVLRNGMDQDEEGGMEIDLENFLRAEGNEATPPTQTQQATTSAPPPPETIAARSAAFTAESRPFESAAAKSGIASLPRDAQAAWAALRFARSPAAARTRLPPKVQREYWKLVNESSLPIRALRKNYDYGAAGSYELARYDAWREKRTVLTCLEVQSREFRERRAREREGVRDRDTGETVVVTEGEIDEERRRRGEMAGLKRELYGVVSGPLEGNPEWDDVVPVAQEEPEGALATIAYPGEYAEAISYLRAVMIKKEYSARCLRLTERIIEMNPAHYTVWLYRAAIIFAMKLPILDEVAWLNEVSLEHLKNYQIWHHRHLLVDNYYPTIANDAEAVKAFGASEIAFLQQILREDTKNYHVWSYRSYLVEKLGLWDVPEELNAIERMIDDDVRNNSAWSHRFFLIFSNPKHSTKGVAATEHDPAAPADIVDREVAYAKEKIVLAPQNQSPWNYLRGVLVKGGRKLASVEEFVLGFMTRLGTESEDVTSSHALDLLAEIYAEKGDKVRAQLCLTRLAEKWDQIRAGYWEWRKKCLEKV